MSLPMRREQSLILIYCALQGGSDGITAGNQITRQYAASLPAHTVPLFSRGNLILHSNE